MSTSLPRPFGQTMLRDQSPSHQRTTTLSFFRGLSPSEQQSAKSIIGDMLGKKNSTYLATRLKGAILRECKSGYENKCSYQELTLALAALKIVPQERSSLKQLFADSNGYMGITHILSSFEFLGVHISGHTMIKFNIEQIKQLQKQQQQQFDAPVEHTPVLATTVRALESLHKQQQSHVPRFRETHTANITPQPTRSATFNKAMRPILEDLNDDNGNQKNDTKRPNQARTPAGSGSSRESALLQALSYAKTTTAASGQAANNDSVTGVEQTQAQEDASTTSTNESNFEDFKRIRLPRPKNVRNELNLRSMATDKDLFSTTAYNGYTHNMKSPLAGAATTTRMSIVDRIKYNHVGYHHFQELEKIFGELDTNNTGLVDRERFYQIVRLHMGKVMKQDLLIEIIAAISEGPSIVASKLSQLLDAYKFDPHYSHPGGKNNSDNYKKKMLDDKDISVQKMSNVHELYVLLIEKLEEKFEKFQRAYYFFDPDPDGKVAYTQFKQALDKLQLRVKDEEVKELFVFLDKKSDGYLDYEELCALVPNRLELEMLDRNTESLADRTRQIYERFGDLQNFNQDPHRNNERARYYSNKFHDETTEKIGKEIFYSDKLKEAINTNMVMRFGRSEPGSVFKYGFNLPADGGHSYGLKPKKGENMYDIMNNNYSKEWTLELEQKRQKTQALLKQIKLKKKSKNTFANMMRQLHNSTTKCNREGSPSSQGTAALNLYETTRSANKFRSTSFNNGHMQQNSNQNHSGLFAKPSTALGFSRQHSSSAAAAGRNNHLLHETSTDENMLMHNKSASAAKHYPMQYDTNASLNRTHTSYQ